LKECSMSPEDAQLLQDFLQQLVQAKGVAKDPEAKAMISRAVAQQPDAAYLLVQRALLVQQALNNAKAEISALQSQLRAAPQTAPDFLDPGTWGNSGTVRPSASQGAPMASPPNQPQYPQANASSVQAPGPGGVGGFLRGGAGSMLGNIAATAAGVAGGAFLFQGLENLLSHHAGNGFLGSQSALANRPEESAAADHEDKGREQEDSLLSGKDGGNNLFDPPGTSSSDFDQLADDLGPDLDAGGSPDDDLFG
jgi:hypothetical protein